MCHSTNQLFCKSPLKNNRNMVLDGTNNAAPEGVASINSGALTSTTMTSLPPCLHGRLSGQHSSSICHRPQPAKLSATDCQNNSQKTTMTAAASSALPSWRHHHLLYPICWQLYLRRSCQVSKEATSFRNTESMTRRSQRMAPPPPASSTTMDSNGFPLKLLR